MFVERKSNLIPNFSYHVIHNKNVHAALKQKFHILEDAFQVSYLDPLKEDMTLSRLTAILLVTAGFLNEVIYYKKDYLLKIG